MIHLYRDLADVLAEPHWHQDVQEWSGDLDDSQAQLIGKRQTNPIYRSRSLFAVVLG